MKILICALMLLGSFATFAGDCKLTANPRSEWENLNGGTVFAPWVDRETILKDVSIEECVTAAVKDLEVPYDGFELKNVVYKFTEKEIKVSGKVSRNK